MFKLYLPVPKNKDILENKFLKIFSNKIKPFMYVHIIRGNLDILGDVFKEYILHIKIKTKQPSVSQERRPQR